MTTSSPIPKRPADRAGSGNDVFCTTRWTVVLAARGNTPAAREALSSLCEAYYEPVLAYLTRALRESAAARDVAHDFFAHLLEGDRLSQVEREGGKFRAYLSGALKHFLAHRRARGQRLRRGGGLEPLSLDATLTNGIEFGDALTDQDDSPDQAFDRCWATTLLARALSALRAEYDEEGQLDRFERLKPWLTGEASFGAQADLARELQMDANALKAAVHRLKRRFRHLVKTEIGSTLTPPADVEEEMRALFTALARE